MSLPIYSETQIKAWDEFTIHHEPVSSTDLMERAATVFTKHLLASNLFRSVTLFCGTGNNGGDGLVTARLLHEKGILVKVLIVEFSKKFSDDFRINLHRLPKEIELKTIQSDPGELVVATDLVIDAVFGSGLNREPETWIAATLDRINACGKRIVSIDIPSGLFATSNKENSLNHVIRANQTITFQSPKMVFTYAQYAGFVGDLRVVDIGLSEQFCENPVAQLVTKNDIQLRERKHFSHKGDHGYLTLIAGFDHYYGAAVLTTKAAMRTGCGYTALHCAEKAFPAVVNALPECIYVPSPEEAFPEKTVAIAIGPGLGTSVNATRLLRKAMAANKPLVVDADAINLLSLHQDLLPSLPAYTILTPHLRELERLIGSYGSPEELLEKQVAFSVKHQVYVIQKGAYSKLTTPGGRIFINSSGNPGMASAGMGDVLTGIIGSLLAQGYPPQEAATYGVFIHGFAADLVKRNQGERGMTASDVVAALPQALNSF